MRWPRCDARGGVAARRARDPVVEVAGGQRDVARRAGRAARRVDPHDLLAAPRRDACRTGSRGVRAPQLVLLGQRQPRRRRRGRRRSGVADPGRRRACRGRTPSARRGRRAARGSVASSSGELLLPGARLDLGRRASRPRAALVRERLLRPCGHQEPDRAARCSSARWASRPAVRARSGIAFTRRGREAEIEQDRRDRQRDVHRQRPAPTPRPPRRAARARAATCGAADPALVGELEDPLRARVDRLVHRVAEARAACRPAAWIACAISSATPPADRRPRRRAPAPPRAAARTPRRCRGSPGPQPRIPAATAPCSEPGSAASVIRAATFVGIIPCSAIATSSRSRKKRCSAVGSSPVRSRWKYSVNVSRPIRSPVRSRPRTSTRSG